jgi:hypothetical protein
VQPLSTILRSRTDLKVPIGMWRWSRAHPYPPVESILKSNFWALPVYESARERLRRPAPVVELKPGTDFVTINTLTGEANVILEGAAEPHAEVCASALVRGT